MPLTVEEVKHIATLARLELDEQQLAHYCQQLSAILDHVAKLSRVDTTGVPATSGLAAEAVVLRADESRPGLEPETLLRNAASIENGQFKIPPVFDQE
ncbi:MAG: Asp-tRNA(Asn)/Glu-tRNA(Gln) amidotransferase subunit GatC [Anaerolineales bacterium]|nr:Asp-tRNA(Asn)/Glu-tRNA(Gln) amidotransferase subunit GatC [Anaerolineales bacterium]